MSLWYNQGITTQQTPPPQQPPPPLFSGDRPEKNLRICGAYNYTIIEGLFGPPQAENFGHFLGVFKGETLQNTRFFRACCALQTPTDVIRNIPDTWPPTNPPLFCRDFFKKGGGLLSRYPLMVTVGTVNVRKMVSKSLKHRGKSGWESKWSIFSPWDGILRCCSACQICVSKNRI